MLRKLRKFFKFPEYKTQSASPYTLPYGMSNSEYLSLQRLTKSEDFQVLTTTLDKVINLYGEHLLASRESADFHFLRGKILGIRFAVEFVDEIRQKEKDFGEYEHNRAKAGNTGEDRRRLATFGTPGWNRTRKAS